MDYQTFPPHVDLSSLVQCYWTLKVPSEAGHDKQRIIPDGSIEMAFILGDDIKRYTSETEFILQPRAMVLGQTIDAFYIKPTGYVDTFAIRFYPYGFANFMDTALKTLINKETPIELLFEKQHADRLESDIVNAENTEQRILIIEEFLLARLNDEKTVDRIVKTTIDTLLETKGSSAINEILKDEMSKRRQLERNFAKQIGISPKQLGKVIRMQSALKMLLNRETESLTQIAYQNEYYDQAHFIKDFQEFTGTNPKEFLNHDQMALSSLFYKKA